MNSFLQFLINPENYAFYKIIRFVFLGVTFYLFAWIFFLLTKNSWLRHRYFEDYTEAFSYRPFERKETGKRWDKIMKLLDSGKESELKLALIDADNLLLEVFQNIGYEQETVGDILKGAEEGVIPNLEDIKEVHQTRNKVVHDLDYSLDREETERILKIYEETLRDLEAI